MHKKHLMISFDNDSWDDIRQMLGLLGQLKCKYCDTIITKENIGGVSHPKNVFCRNNCCLISHVREQEEKHDAKVGKRKWTLCELHKNGDPDYPKEQCRDCTFAIVSGDEQ